MYAQECSRPAVKRIRTGKSPSVRRSDERTERDYRSRSQSSSEAPATSARSAFYGNLTYLRNSGLRISRYMQTLRLVASARQPRISSTKALVCGVLPSVCSVQALCPLWGNVCSGIHPAVDKDIIVFANAILASSRLIGSATRLLARSNMEICCVVASLS